MTERLQKLIAQTGFASRRKAEELIVAGKVSVNGKIVRELGAKFSTDSTIVIDGKKLPRREKKVYYLLNKPKGYISTTSDERGRKTVTLLLPPDSRIYPVGRLDRDTEGLLLLTNDGQLADLLLHPRFTIDKTYVATIAGEICAAALDKIRVGLLLDNETRPTAPAKVRLLSVSDGKSKIEITIHEGRNRQIRRMFAAVGYEVLALKRIGLAFLTLAGVRRGKWRKLTDDEVHALYALAEGKS